MNACLPSDHEVTLCQILNMYTGTTWVVPDIPPLPPVSPVTPTSAHPSSPTITTELQLSEFGTYDTT